MEKIESTLNVTLVVLTWRVDEDIISCIAPLYSPDVLPPQRTIVVDNASRNPQLSIIRRRFPVHIIYNSHNRGVAPARNQAIREATTKYLCFLDCDMLPSKKLLQNMVHVMDINPDVGIAGPQLLSTKGEKQESCRPLPTLLHKLGRRIPWMRIFPGVSYHPPAAWSEQRLGWVDYVIGACQMVRRRALEATGYYDESIFYGPEDIDLCLRMWREGFGVAYVPSARAVHLEQRITYVKPLSWHSLMHLRGLAHFFNTHGYLFNAPQVKNEQWKDENLQSKFH